MAGTLAPFVSCHPDHPMTPRTADRLADRLRQHAAPLHGRDAELKRFDDSLAGAPSAASVFLVHGPGGIGKTTLLNEMRARAATAGLDCVRLDGRDIEPSVYGVLQGLGIALGLPSGEPLRLPDLLAHWHARPRSLLLIDTFERLAHLEHWVRDTLLAELPPQSVAVLAGRTTPGDHWRTDAAWRRSTCVLALRNLSRADSDRALAARGLDEATRHALVDMSHGHPLALMLLADVAETQGGIPAELGPHVIRRLIECFVAQVPSALHREALNVCALARVANEQLLAQTVDAASSPGLFDWLAGLSFVESSAEGLYPHELVRDAIAAELRWRHPERLRQLTDRLLEHHISQAREAGAHSRHRAALDIVYLNRGHPLMHRFIDFASLGTVSCDPALPSDLAPIAALVGESLGPQHEALLRRWHGHPAAMLWTVRDPTQQVAGAMMYLDVARLAAHEMAQDPALASLRRWLDAQAPLRPGETALFDILSVARGGLQEGAIWINAIQARSVSIWMSQARLAIYAIATAQPEHWSPMMGFIDFHAIDQEGFMRDAQPHGIFAHDWRNVPLRPWLDTMSSRLAQPDQPAAADTDAVPPILVLSEAMFHEAVQDALKHWHDPALFGGNPLLRSRLVRQAAAAQEAPSATLMRLIGQAIGQMAAQPRNTRFARAIELTYLRPAGSQELAAERLGIPFGTYRYQRRTALARIAQVLWVQEVGPQPRP